MCSRPVHFHLPYTETGGIRYSTSSSPTAGRDGHREKKVASYSGPPVGSQTRSLRVFSNGAVSATRDLSAH